MNHWYKLDENRNPVPVDLMTGAVECEERVKTHRQTGVDPWSVGKDEIVLEIKYAGSFLGVRYGKKEIKVTVSTVFLGLDHSFGGGPPVLFETMVFGMPDGSEYQDRYHTWQEAEAGHREVVRKLRNGEKLG
jgi:hypothetical protein